MSKQKKKTTSEMERKLRVYGQVLQAYNITYTKSIHNRSYSVQTARIYLIHACCMHETLNCLDEIYSLHFMNKKYLLYFTWRNLSSYAEINDSKEPVRTSSIHIIRWTWCYTLHSSWMKAKYSLQDWDISVFARALLAKDSSGLAQCQY